jgi:hypothetical protein
MIFCKSIEGDGRTFMHLLVVVSRQSDLIRDQDPDFHTPHTGFIVYIFAGAITCSIAVYSAIHLEQLYR